MLTSYTMAVKRYRLAARTHLTLKARARDVLSIAVHELYGTATHMCATLVWEYKRRPASLYLRTGMGRYRTGTSQTEFKRGCVDPPLTGRASSPTSGEEANFCFQNLKNAELSSTFASRVSRMQNCRQLLLPESPE